VIRSTIQRLKHKEQWGSLLQRVHYRKGGTRVPGSRIVTGASGEGGWATVKTTREKKTNLVSGAAVITYFSRTGGRKGGEPTRVHSKRSRVDLLSSGSVAVLFPLAVSTFGPTCRDCHKTPPHLARQCSGVRPCIGGSQKRSTCGVSKERGHSHGFPP